MITDNEFYFTVLYMLRTIHKSSVIGVNGSLFWVISFVTAVEDVPLHRRLKQSGITYGLFQRSTSAFYTSSQTSGR